MAIPMFGVALLVVLLVLPLVVWLAARVRRLESEQYRNTQLIKTLLARVYALEHSTPEPASRPEAPVAVEPPPAPQPQPAPTPEPAPVRQAPPPARDWESIVGGNLLNKVGALVLVVGIGLFLAYSLAHLGPAGKVAIGLVIGASMILAGVVLEGRPVWSSFGHGFVAGGWAAVYFTTYAMHGLDAARIIDDPATGTALLLGVSVLMILHSLVYRSESATGVAYVIAFVTLNVTPLTQFTAIASLILAASLLIGAERFGWPRLGAAGAFLAYGTFGLTYEPSVYGRAGIWNGQSLLWTYWILFESYDLLNVYRRNDNRMLVRALFWVNAAGFLGASILHRWKMETQEWAIFFAFGAVAYTVSTLLRRRLPSSTYKGAAAVAVGMASAAIVEQFAGVRASFLLFLLGEALVIAGLLVKDDFLRWLGRLVFLLPLVRLPLHTGQLEIAGHSFAEWTPLAFVMAIAFYADRFFERSGVIYPIAADVLLLAVTWVELEPAWVAPVWAVGLLLAVGLWRRRQAQAFAWQAYALIVLVAVRVTFAPLWVTQSDARIVSASVALAVLFAAHFVLRQQAWAAPLAAVVLAIVLENEVASRLITVAWGMEAAALVIAGFALRDRASRLTGLAGFLVCILRLFLHDLKSLDTLARILSFIVLGLILLGASWVYTRYREQIRRYL
jgi:hypothetical protein